MSDQSTIEWTEALKARFWSNVNKAGPIAPGMDTPCWVWTAGCFTNGYGQFRAGTRKVRAHRAAYEIVFGPILNGAILRHRCDVPRCCRPDHVLPGTHQENAQDRVDRGRSSTLPPPVMAGESNPAARLTKAQAIEIRVLLGDGCTREELAATYGVSPSTVRAIEENRIWRGYGPEDLD